MKHHTTLFLKVAVLLLGSVVSGVSLWGSYLLFNHPTSSAYAVKL